MTAKSDWPEVTIGTSEHKLPGTGARHLTIRTIITGDTYGIRDQLKKHDYKWHNRYGWWFKDRYALSILVGWSVRSEFSTLSRDCARAGVRAIKGEHVPLKENARNRRGL